MNETVKLFWFSKEKLQNIPITNFGDDINPILINKITGKDIEWVNPSNRNIFKNRRGRINFAIGSILHFGTNRCNIWGSGLIDSKSKFPVKANYYAVRGPMTYNILKEKKCKVNSIFGDPAILIPRFFDIPIEKKYKLGVIPHYTEIEGINKCEIFNSKEIRLINLQNDCYQILRDIASCEMIISSSLHGIIVAMAYGVPVVRISLTNNIYGDGIKYEDFYQSVGIAQHTNYKINLANITFKEILNLFSKNQQEMYIATDLVNMQDKLLSVMPF